MAYAIFASDNPNGNAGGIFEQNPDFGPIGEDIGFRLVSGQNGLPTQFLSVAAEAHTADNAFGIAANQLIYQISPTVNQQVNPALTATQISATQTATAIDELFAKLTDGSLEEFMFVSGSPPTNVHKILPGGVNQVSAP